MHVPRTLGSGYCGNQFFFFSGLRAADKNADAESRPKPKLTHIIFTYSVESVTTVRCRRMDAYAGARALISSEMRGINSNNETKRMKKKIARAREMIISSFRMPHYCWHFFFVSLCSSVDWSTVLGSWHTKNDYFCFFFVFFAFHFVHSVLGESRSKIAQNIGRNVLFYILLFFSCVLFA